VSNYPPKLLTVSATDFGSVLFLDDGAQVSINVCPARLNEAMIAYGLPPLAELLGGRSIGVFVGMLEMSAAQWDCIRERIRFSTQASAVFSQYASLWTSFGEPYDIIVGKVHRLYGGLSRALYTSPPLNFRPDPNRPLCWYRALLSAPGGWLFNTSVSLDTGEVEIEADQLPGHFVE
jgi:hypothetical protein